MNAKANISRAWSVTGTRQHSENGDFFKALRRRYRLLLACLLLGVGGAVAAILILPAVYSARAVMRVDVDDIDTSSPTSALSSTRELELRRDHQIQSQLQLLNSRPLMRAVVRDLALYDDPEFNPAYGKSLHIPANLSPAQRRNVVIPPLTIEAVTDRLINAVKIAQDGTTEFINIDVSSANPIKAARIANKIASTYIATQILEKKQSNTRAIQMLQRQVADLRDEIISGERSTADYKREHQLDGTDVAGSAALRVSQLAGDLATAQAERAEVQSKVADAAKGPLSSPLLNDLRAQESTAMQHLADLTTNFGSGHPDVQKARAQLAQIQNSIVLETARARQALATELRAQRARENQLASQLGAVRSRSLNDLITAVPLADMDRNRDATRTVYVALLGRLDTLVRENELVRADASLAFTALPPTSPSAPKAGRIIVASIAGSLLIGVAMVLIADQLDTALRTPRQVWAISRLPTLGMLPELRKRRRQQLAPDRIDQPYSAFSEEVRSVFAKLVRLLPAPGTGVVSITSAEPGDGKTTLSLALAAAAIAVDRTVVLLDLDLRRPNMARSLGLDRDQPDLLDYLAGDASIEAVTQSCPHAPLLKVMAPFRAAGDPIALLMSERLKALLDQLRASNHLVVVNTPPVLAVADAATIAGMIDINLLVLYWGRTTAERLRSVVAEMGEEITGVIFNHVSPTHAPRSNYENYSYHRNSGRLRRFALTRRRVERALAAAGSASDPADISGER